MSFYGLIYGYPRYVGQVRSLNLRRRHLGHLRIHPDWPEPIILERVIGKDYKDFLFNLGWAETVWMFKMHTYRPIWPEGFNLAVGGNGPSPEASRAGGLIGGKRVNELHPGHAKFAGRVGGLSLHKRHPGLASKTMLKTHQNNPELAKQSGRHARHIQLGCISKDCPWCKEKIT